MPQGTSTRQEWQCSPLRPACNTHKVKPMYTAASKFIAELAYESGVTAIEYGLLAALIAVVIIGAVSATGNSLVGLYVYWSATVNAAL